MANESRFSVFGMPSPEEVRASIGKSGMEQDLALASLPLDRVGVFAAAQGGRHLGNAVMQGLGYQRTEELEALKRAATVKGVTQSALESSGGNQEMYLEKLAGGLAEAGYQTDALSVIDQLSKVRKERIAGEQDVRRNDLTEAKNRIDKAFNEGKLDLDFYKAFNDDWYNKEQARLTQIRDEDERGYKQSSLEVQRTQANNQIRIAEMQYTKPNTNLQRYQTDREQLQVALDNNPNMNPAAKERIVNKINELNKGIEYETTRVGRTETDARIAKGMPSFSDSDVLKERIDVSSNAIDDLDAMIKTLQEDPSLGGVTGTIRRYAQYTAGTAVDLISMLGPKGATVANSIISKTMTLAANHVEQGRLSKEDYDSLFSKDVAEIPLFETAMAYLLSNSYKDAGKLNTDDVKRFSKDVQVTGLTGGSTNVIAKLEKIKENVTRNKTQLEKRLGSESNSAPPDANLQKALEKIKKVGSKGKEQVIERLRGAGYTDEQLTKAGIL